MIAEGSSSSSQTPVPRGGSSQPPSERDLLAERRARRAAESGENALLRRAETAEATVKTAISAIIQLCASPSRKSKAFAASRGFSWYALK